MSIIGGNTSFWLEGPENRLKYFGQRCALGTLIPQLGGSRIICKNGGIAWLVAPISTEVSRTWYCRNDVLTRAIAVTSVTTGWFLPTSGQLSNPGYVCRTNWDYSISCYWTSTQFHPPCNRVQSFNPSHGRYIGLKTHTMCIRAFRCITY